MRSLPVKVCCISSIDEAELAIRLGAAALGLVSSMPSGPGVIPESLIAQIAKAVENRAETILLTSESDPVRIRDQVGRCGVSGVQLCTWLDDPARERLRTLLPSTMLMQVVHVVDESSVERGLSAQKHVDRLLLDSGTLSGPVLELGGTGRTHDWAHSRQIVAGVSVPVFLAGGLNAHNVGDAIQSVKPFGLDLCSSVRLEGALDEDRLATFMGAVDRARVL